MLAAVDSGPFLFCCSLSCLLFSFIYIYIYIYIKFHITVDIYTQLCEIFVSMLLKHLRYNSLVTLAKRAKNYFSTFVSPFFFHWNLTCFEWEVSDFEMTIQNFV